MSQVCLQSSALDLDSGSVSILCVVMKSILLYSQLVTRGLGINPHTYSREQKFRALHSPYARDEDF